MNMQGLNIGHSIKPIVKAETAAMARSTAAVLNKMHLSMVDFAFVEIDIQWDKLIIFVKPCQMALAECNLDELSSGRNHNFVFAFYVMLEWTISHVYESVVHLFLSFLVVLLLTI